MAIITVHTRVPVGDGIRRVHRLYLIFALIVDDRPVIDWWTDILSLRTKPNRFRGSRGRKFVDDH